MNRVQAMRTLSDAILVKPISFIVNGLIFFLLKFYYNENEYSKQMKQTQMGFQFDFYIQIGDRHINQ